MEEREIPPGIFSFRVDSSADAGSGLIKGPTLAGCIMTRVSHVSV